MSRRCVFKCDHDPNSLTNTLPQNQWFRTVMTCFLQQITNFLHNINHNGISNKQAILQQRALGRELGLVIDLTNTTRYYPLSDWTKEGIGHVKIRCKGRDSVPEDESVQKFCNENHYLSLRQQINLHSRAPQEFTNRITLIPCTCFLMKRSLKVLFVHKLQNGRASLILTFMMCLSQLQTIVQTFCSRRISRGME